MRTRNSRARNSNVSSSLLCLGLLVQVLDVDAEQNEHSLECFGLFVAGKVQDKGFKKQALN
jgi:hypothetical protein